MIDMIPNIYDGISVYATCTAFLQTLSAPLTARLYMQSVISYCSLQTVVLSSKKQNPSHPLIGSMLHLNVLSRVRS